MSGILAHTREVILTISQTFQSMNLGLLLGYSDPLGSTAGPSVMRTCFLKGFHASFPSFCRVYWVFTQCL